MPGFHFKKYNIGDVRSVLGPWLLPTVGTVQRRVGSRGRQYFSVASWLTGKP